MNARMITELTDCWIIDGKIVIPKKPKPKSRKRMTWFDNFVFDLFNFYKQKGSKMGVKYFEIESASYPLGITVKFIKNEIKYYLNIRFCEIGTEPKEITEKEFLKLVKDYEN